MIRQSWIIKGWLRWAEWVVGGLLLGLMAYQLVMGAKADGVTFDEPIHLLSGYAVLTDQHMLIDPEHPWLAKAWAALPLLWMDIDVPEGAEAIPPELVGLGVSTYDQSNQWGWQMLFASGNDPYQLLLAGRLMMVGLTLLTAVVVWLWSRQLFGRVGGLATLTLFSVDPTILAHGHYINTDLAAVLWWVLTLASLWQFLTKRSLRWMILTGLAMAGGLLTKFSLISLLGLVPLLMVAWLIYHRTDIERVALSLGWWQRIDGWLQRKWKNVTEATLIWVGYGLAAAVMVGVALAMVWLSYGAMWLINPQQNPIWVIGSPIAWVLAFLPGMYAKGMGVIGGDRSGYLLGYCYKGSHWAYFPVLTFFKLPLGSLLLLLIGSASWLIMVIRRRVIGKLPFIAWYLGLGIVFYYGLSMFAGVNIGVRHALPGYTLLLIVGGYVASVLWQWGLARIQWLGKCLVILLMVLAAWASLSVSPYYLPYFNILSGEPHNRPWVADDSNTDWGESSKALAEFVKERGIERIGFNNFVGWTEVRHLGVPVVGVRPTDRDFKGWLAISRSGVVYHYCRLENDWAWLIDHHQPVAIVGGAINVYYLE